jgi:hypothetical protein
MQVGGHKYTKPLSCSWQRLIMHTYLLIQDKNKINLVQPADENLF